MTSHALVTTAEDWRRAVAFCLEQEAVSVDIETTGLSPWGGAKILGISVGVPGRAWYCPVAHTPVDERWQGLNVPDGVTIVRPLLESPRVRKVFHNALFDCKFFLALHGIETRSVDCTMIMGAVQDERRLSPLWLDGRFKGRNLNLDALSEELLGWNKGEAERRLAAWCREHGPALLGLPPRKAAPWRRSDTKWKEALAWAPLDLVAAYACMDADLPLRCEERLRAAGLPRVYDEVERPLIPAVVRMVCEPKVIDVDYCRDAAALALAWERAAVAGAGAFGINPFSTRSIVEALFSRKGAFLPVQGWTKGGKNKENRQPSTNALALGMLSRRHAAAAYVLEARTARKFRTTYLTPLAEQAVPWSGRPCIFPAFLQHRAATGRFSSAAPNFQNMPRGDVVRRAVVTPDDDTLLAFFDYAQIEPRLMAHFGQEERLINAFVHGQDVYSTMAVMGMFSEVRGWDPARVRKERKDLRQVAKVAVLATFYGAKGKKMREILLTQADVLLPVGECEQIVWRIRSAFPRIDAFVRTVTRRAARDRLIRNPWGRERHVGFREGGCDARDAFNTVIQGTAADVMKRAILRVDRLLVGTGARMMLTVHDDLGLYIPKNELALVPEIKRAMEENWPFRVPMKVEVALSTRSWADKRELSDEKLAAMERATMVECAPGGVT